MTQHEASAKDDIPARTSVWWSLVTLLAVVLAVAGIGCLAYLVTVRLAGGQAWTGLNWIAMFSLPIAFILMILTVLRAALRRRRL